MSLDIFQKRFQKKFDVMIIAHRGASKEARENTLRAFELAIDAGAEMIEFDVHKTVDNHVVVIHDRYTGRVSKVNIDVHNSTLEQVRDVPLKGGLQIPTLDKFFSHFKGKVYFNIEIKQYGLESEIYALIDKYNLRNQCVISSFLHRILPIYNETKKEVLTALIEIGKIKLVKRAMKMRLDGIHPEYLLVTPELVSNAHSNNLFINTWTTDHLKDWIRLIKCGVDGIMTDKPRELYKFLESR
ncbi:MAG: glycerophosphodiester phosphodiesterase [Promethearchaeota archaeon]